jgi:hypothetical protein
VDTRSIRTSTPNVPAQKPKVARCAGCNGKYPRRELIELHEDNHDNLTSRAARALTAPASPTRLRYSTHEKGEASTTYGQRSKRLYSRR